MDSAAHKTSPAPLWRAATNTRLLIASAIVSFVVGTVGGIGWVLILREVWGVCSGTLGFGPVEQRVVSALLLVAGLVVAVSVFRMSRDTTRIGRVQAIVYWVATAGLWLLMFAALTTSYDLRASCSQSLFL